MPDFRIQPNSFPIASVIDAAQRNNQLQEQARQAGNQSLIAGLQSIGQVGQSLFDQKVRMAQALAGAKMYAQQNPGLVGDNQVTKTPQGPVTQNQTAAYDPNSGTVMPSKPMDISTIASAMYGIEPKDIMQNQVQRGELALKQKVEPQKIAVEREKALSEIQNAQVMRQIQAMLAGATIKNQAQERAQAAQNSEFEANKTIMAAGSPLNPFNPITFAQKKAAAQALSGSADHSAAIKWAQQNPKDPRAATILQRAGQALSGQ